MRERLFASATRSAGRHTLLQQKHFFREILNTLSQQKLCQGCAWQAETLF